MSSDPNEIVEPGVRGPSGRGETGLTPDGRLKTGRLAGLPMWTAIWVLAWPITIDALLGSLVGLTDTVLAAGVSEPATDAIGAASYLLWFIGLFFASLDIGATALISRSIGAGRKATANAAVGQVLIMAVVVGLTLGAGLYAITPWLAAAMGLEGQASADFRTYMRIIAFDVPVMGLMYAGIACLRGSGDSLRPMRALLVVNLVNIVASWTLAGVDIAITREVNGVATRHVWLHNPMGFDMGVAGIGLGTLLGHVAGAALILATLVRGTGVLRIVRRRLVPHWVTLWRILRVGLPSFAEMLGMWLGNFLIILLVGRIGAGILGAHILVVRIEAISFQIGFAIAIASASLAGQYLGAGSAAMARTAILRCTMAACAVMGTLGIVFALAPRTIIGLVSGQPTHLEAAPAALMITGLIQIPFAISIVLRQAMRGVGDVKVTMWITWLCTYAVRLPLVYLFSGVDLRLPASLGGGTIPHPIGHEPSLAGVWIGLCAELVIRAAAFTWRFVQGGWSRKRV